MSSDQINDDAEFDAFLNGEGGLADGLQGLPQPSPSAALDAAILARARTDMAREARPEAANDARVHGRWRLPAGLAAAVLAGVLGHQAWKNNADAERAAMEPKDLATAAPAVAPAPPPPPAGLEGQAPAQVLAEVSKSQQASRARASAGALTHAPARAPAQVPAHAQAPERAPAPMQARVSPSAAPEPAREAAIADKRIESSAKPSVTVPAAPAAPAPDYFQPHQASEYGRSAPASAVAAAAATSAASATAASPAPPAPFAYSGAAPVARRVEITGNSITRSDLATVDAPEPWLKRIAGLLAGGDKQRALAEWRSFRTVFPDYPVDPPLAAAIKAAQE